MTDCIEIGNKPWQSEVLIGEDTDMELTIESGFGIEIEAEFTDDSELHLIVGDIVEESVADETEYDFGMEFSTAETAFIYVGPALPNVEVEWSTDAWFHSDAWFISEAW